MRGIPADSADEEIQILQKIVEFAEARLGPKAFREMVGHFWLIHETRPYMRARQAYADALHRAGRFEESCAEVQAMLVLNPGDNQGLRYRQISVHLTRGKLDEVRKLLQNHSHEIPNHTVFAWMYVLERYLSGDLDEAAVACVRAHQQNPHSLPYVLARRKPPRHLRDGYSLRSVEEAMCFAEDLQRAWNAYPLAQKWLKTQKLQKK